MNPVIPEVLITDQPLTSLAPKRFSSESGGVVEFYGVVRGKEGENEIEGIYYESHPKMAAHQLLKLAQEACSQFQILELTVHHRVGFIPAAEPSLFLRISAKHRHPAFEAAEWLIVQLKLRVPIWKHPVDSVSLQQSF